MVNFLACREPRPSSQEQHFWWGTGLEITESNIEALMRAGRARWRIEHETLVPRRTTAPALSTTSSATSGPWCRGSLS